MPEIKTYRIDNFAGGLNLKNDSMVALGGINPSQCIKAINCDFRDKVSIQTRNGYKKTFDNIFNADITGIIVWYKDGLIRFLIKTWDSKIYYLYDGVTFLNSEESDYFQLSGTVYNGHLFLPGAADGVENKKYDGLKFTKLGITAPDTAPTVAEGATGNLSGTYNYYYSYYNSNTGQESGLSPVGEITVSAKQVTVTPIFSSDTQVTHIRLYRAGGNAGPTVDGSYVKRRIDTSLNDGNGEIALTDVNISTYNGTELITNTDVWWSTTGDAAVGATGTLYLTDSGNYGDVGTIYRKNLLTVDTQYQINFKLNAYGLSSTDNHLFSIITYDASGQTTVMSEWVSGKSGTYTIPFKAEQTDIRLHLTQYEGFILEIKNFSIKALTSDGTNYTDNIADGSISTTAEDCSTNLVCPVVRILSAHHHELFGANNPDNPGWLYTSRWRNTTGNANIEAFPGSDFISDVGNKSDPIVAIMPLEIDMIIYTEHKIYRHRYLSNSDESSVALEEVSEIGCAGGKTLAEGILENGRPCHIFLGQSTKGRGIYLFEGTNVYCISDIVEPIFSGEREDVSSINWNYTDRCCGAMHDNKYFLCYPEGATIWPDKVLIVDFETMPPRFIQADFSAYTLFMDKITNRLFFGNTDKYLYEFSSAHGFSQSIEIDFQTPYFGDRGIWKQAKSLTFFADTQGNDLTVNYWVDRELKATDSQSSDYMKILKFDCPPEVKGYTFSIELICSSTKRIKISPPLELKVIELNKK